MMRPLRPLLLSAVLVLAACGQKSGVADESGDSGGGDAGSGGAPATTAAAPTTAPGETTVPGDTTPAGDTTTPTTAAPAHEAGPNDTAGVTDDEIVIGIHAPVTGASPIPQTSFDIGKDIYWKFLAESAPDALFGRKVRVVFRDDEFNPQTAPCRSAGRWSSRRARSCSSAAAAPTRSRPAPSTPTRTASRTSRPASTRTGLADLVDLLRHVADLRRSRRRCSSPQLQERGFDEGRRRRRRHPVVRRRPRGLRRGRRGGRPRRSSLDDPHQQDGAPRPSRSPSSRS